MTKFENSNSLAETVGSAGPPFTPIDRFPRPAAVSDKVNGDQAVALSTKLGQQSVAAVCVGDDWVDQHIYFDYAETLLRPLAEPTDYASWTSQLATRAATPSLDLDTALAELGSNRHLLDHADSLSKAVRANSTVAPRAQSPVPPARVLALDVPIEELPVWMDLGNWNYCPRAELHRALITHWQDSHGACLLCVSATTIELTVSEPVSGAEELVKLAREQIVYCPDIIQMFQRVFDYDEDPRTMNLSSPLDFLDVAAFVAHLKSDRWTLWWD